jgi:hypothetical protein
VSTPIRSFRISCIVLLSLTATAKLVSAAGHEKILVVQDWVLHLQYRHLMLLGACIEFGVIGAVLLARHEAVGAKAVLWFSALAMNYRILYHLVAPPVSCPCLGTLTSNLNIPPGVADRVMWAILVYLLMGSALSLFIFHYRTGGKDPLGL